MKSITTRQTPADGASFELGKISGQSLAFGTIAGRCSAAQAAAIRQARNEKIHASLGLSWKEFCRLHLKIGRTHADQLIGFLEEFGPDYFEHTQSVRISAGTYRLVAPFIKEKALRVDGETLELNSANVQKVAQSVRDSQKALMPPAEPALPEPAPGPDERLTALSRQVTEILAEFRAVNRLRREAEVSLIWESQLRATLSRLHGELERVGLEMGLVL